MAGKHANKPVPAPAADYWRLVAAGEPFRLLFPLGTLIGIGGVLLWPLHACHAIGTYPGTIHSRLMIQGFLTSFVVGFLGTALPRLLAVPPLTLRETLGFAGAVMATALLHVGGLTFWGDLLFVGVLGGLLCVLGARGFLRQDVPPPAFVLAALGLLSAAAGSCLLIVAAAAPLAVPAGLLSLARLAMNQGYLLLPIMGIGAFFLPRFFGLPNRQDFPESLAPPPGWTRRAAFALACGLAAVAGFALEAGGSTRWGCGLRAAAVSVYLLREVPVHRAGLGGGSLAGALRLALLALPAGYLTMAAWPARASSLLHVVLVTGFSLIAFVVASRVVLGHSGQSEKFHATLRPVVAMTALIALAMLTRVTADWLPAVRLSHYGYAALAWVAAALIWARAILPGVQRADLET